MRDEKKHRSLTTCALTASRRHACPRTQMKPAGRRSFLDLKNRRSRACASGAYSPYVRMAHERDRRFLWLKSDGNSPTLTEPRAHKPTIHAFRDRVLPKLHENFLHVFPEPIKSLSVPERDAPARAIQKHTQQKQTGLKRKYNKLPTTLNTTAKDKAQNVA